MVLCLVLAFITSACGDGADEPAQGTHRLYVIETYWSGDPYVENPGRILHEYDLSTKGWQTCPEDSASEKPFRFRITKTGEDYLEIETSWTMSVLEDGILSLQGDGTKFTVQEGVMLALVTPTTDYGEIFEFYYQGSESPEPVTN